MPQRFTAKRSFAALFRLSFFSNQSPCLKWIWCLKKADLVIVDISNVLGIFDIYINGWLSFRNRLFFSVETDRPIRGEMSPRFRRIVSTNSQGFRILWGRYRLLMETCLHRTKESSPQATCERFEVSIFISIFTESSDVWQEYCVLIRQGHESQRSWRKHR